MKNRILDSYCSNCVISLFRDIPQTSANSSGIVEKHTSGIVAGKYLTLVTILLLVPLVAPVAALAAGIKELLLIDSNHP